MAFSPNDPGVGPLTAFVYRTHFSNLNQLSSASDSVKFRIRTSEWHLTDDASQGWLAASQQAAAGKGYAKKTLTATVTRDSQARVMSRYVAECMYVSAPVYCNKRSQTLVSSTNQR